MKRTPAVSAASGKLPASSGRPPVGPSSSSSSAPKPAARSSSVGASSRPSAGRTSPSLSAGSAASSSQAAALLDQPKYTRDTSLSSKRLNPNKTSDPFANPSQKHKTNFGIAYTSGAIPARIMHSGVRLQLQWDVPLHGLNYNPLLITCAEGFRETEHPFCFVAKQGFKELLMADGGGEKAAPLVAKLVLPIRQAFMTPSDAIFSTALDAVEQLSIAVGPVLNEHLNVLLVQVSKKIMDKKYRDRIFEVLQALEQNGGPDAIPLIKAKCPTYTPSNMF